MMHMASVAQSHTCQSTYLGQAFAHLRVHADEIGDFELPSIDDGKHAGVVAVGGLLLAKIPNETREERNAYFSDRAQQQQEAIDTDLLKESDPSSPMLKPQRTSSVTFGGGKRS